ncbi:MAG: universal stress protein [Dermatophilaceae bacterium]|jgi:nucleotide-binding universal stress UspA family protein|nr:universal stress protein [Candidatus Lutibacillus vidarii]HON75730.1 universal stress protein [Dermatophilaceae bacterium]HRB99734.1 universal stress protein [Dermatophilaceae bacterium]
MAYTTAWRPGRREEELVDIVVGLAPDGYADDVAEVAVERAVELGARLRFIQVVDPDLVGADRDEADRATFRSALRALRGHRGVPCSFQVVAGDPTEALLESASRAAVLVVGEDDPRGSAHVAEECRRRAHCEVVTVPTRRRAS